VLVESILDLLAGPLPDVSLINTVPSAAKELVRFARFPASARVVNLAGEALYQDLVDAIYAVAPHVAKVFNLYGPSEDTTYSTWYLAPRGAGGAAVPIGRALPGKHAHLLDEQFSPSPADTPGEVCMAGDGLSAGYLDDAELTARKFVVIADGPLAGTRVYRTGDIGARNANGELTYLGRVDRQVKVRGVRIEPGEIESALRAITGVRDAAVHKAVDAHKNDHLLAFVTVGDATVVPGEIGRALRGKLPEVMLPARIEVLPTIPLTANGKVDHLELAAIARALLA
jgi:non-ribosomal peptide synthetase component F